MVLLQIATVTTTDIGCLYTRRYCKVPPINNKIAKQILLVPNANVQVNQFSQRVNINITNACISLL